MVEDIEFIKLKINLKLLEEMVYKLGFLNKELCYVLKIPDNKT